jgi:hypothetical protein
MQFVEGMNVHEIPLHVIEMNWAENVKGVDEQNRINTELHLNRQRIVRIGCKGSKVPMCQPAMAPKSSIRANKNSAATAITAITTITTITTTTIIITTPTQTLSDEGLLAVGLADVLDPLALLLRSGSNHHEALP